MPLIQRDTKVYANGPTTFCVIYIILTHIMYMIYYLTHPFRRDFHRKNSFRFVFQSRIDVYILGHHGQVYSNNNKDAAIDRSEISCAEHLLKTVERGSRGGGGDDGRASRKRNIRRTDDK